MFKIESYITPIILSHVAKYVKNLRPQDSQVSLWGGEVAFQNLDLRLDVLEEELQLPFSFLSGHIHELIIHVPWTKIASEPITITINTIEFVLKLRNEEENNTAVRREKRKKVSKEEDLQAPPGYMSSLINKIANNISLKCNNIILKYVEEDIVVSMNVQLLSIDSADSEWNPAFIDISPTKVTIRKVININDLTICLDKRNSAGKIDVCQEPILYRCTMQLRLLRRYNLSTVRNSSVTRIDIHTESMDLNISSQQFPMMMRLVILLTALKQGKIKSKTNLPANGEAAIVDVQDMVGQSFFSWAWDMLPSIFPDENLNEDSQYELGHILQFGAYVGRLKFTLKSQEIIADSVVNTTKKIKYNSILKLVMDGVFCDATKLGQTFFNFKGGITNFGIYPLGDCTCGQKQAFPSILTTPTYSEVTYVNDSLFDLNSVENTGKSKMYNNSLDVHFLQITEEVMLNKSPGIAIDMVSQVEIPDNYARSSELDSDLEYSNLSEKSYNRLIIGPFTFKYCAGVIHLIETIQEYIKLYDYPPYVNEKPFPLITQLPPPSTDDFEALINEVPLNTYQIVLIQPIVELHMWDHDKQMKCSRKKKTNPLSRENSSILSVLTRPYLSIVGDRIEVNITMPLYPNRLVYTTCQLPSPPKNLFDSCFINLTLQTNALTMNLHQNDTITGSLLTIPNLLVNINSIIHPSLWIEDDIKNAEYNIDINELIITMNRPQQILLITILLSVINKNVNYLTNLNTVLLQDVRDLTKPLIDITINDIKLRFIKLKYFICFSSKIIKIYGITYIPEIVNKKATIQRHLCQAVIISGPDKLSDLSLNSDEPLLSIVVQFSLDKNVNNYPSICAIKLNEFNINIDPILKDFIDYNLNTINSCCETSEIQSKHSLITETPNRASSEKLNKAKSRSGIGSFNVRQTPLEAVHSASSEQELVLMNILKEPEEKISSDTDSYKFYELCKSLILTVELRQCSVFISNKSFILLSSTSTVSEVVENTPNLSIAVFKTPIITITTSIGRSIEAVFHYAFPITLPVSMWSENIDYFPWTMTMWGLTCYVLEGENSYEFLTPIKTNITLAITYKENSEENNSVLAVCLHIDTSPVVVNVNEKENKFLIECIQTFLSLTNIGINQIGGSKCENNLIEIVEGPSSPGTNMDLKEIFGLTPNDSSTKESSTVLDGDNQAVFVSEANTKEKKLSLWLQWTFTKFSIQFFTEDNDVKHKFVIDLEDILLSIDKQNVYTKVKNKIGSLNGEYYIMNENSWEKNYNFGITTRPDTDIVETVNDTFLDMTITIAECNNVHTKWGTNVPKKDNTFSNNELIEVMINIQQTDFRLEMNVLLLFLKKFSFFSGAKTKPVADVKENSNPSIKIISSADIPLLYLDCKGIRIFLPVENQSADCNVLFFKINRITITPNVENPLARLPLRPDIYTKAAQLRILNTPGSKIEDRQYELLLRDISIGTANWKNLVDHILQNTENDNHENPAFEWNNIPKKTMLDLNTIFKHFNFSIVYAPCILYKNLLICGQGLELNCLTDLLIELTTKQIFLIHNLFEITNAMSLNEPEYDESVQSNVMEDKGKVKKLSKHSLQSNKYLQYDEIIEFNETNRKKLLISNNNDNNMFTDSGIETQSIGYGHQSNITLDRNSSQKFSTNKTQTTPPTVVVPYDFWFIGGIFTIKLYHSLNNYNMSFDDFKFRLPLLKATFEQPNMLITQTIYDKKIQLSLFNIQINFGSDPNLLRKTNDEYGDSFFETKPLNINNSGIPSSILKIKCTKNVTKRVNEVEIEVLRSIKVSLSDKTLEKILAIYLIILNECFKTSKAECFIQKRATVKPIIGGNKIKLIKKQLFDIKKIKIQIAQTTLECIKPRQYTLKVLYKNVDLNIELLERPEKIAFKFLLKSLLIQNNNLIILQPCTIAVNGSLIQENWQTTPVCQLNMIINYLQIDFGPLNIDSLLLIHKTFSTCFDTYEKQIISVQSSIDNSQDDSTNLSSKTSDNLMQIITPKCSYKKSKTSEEFYQDDLRAGAFQFIETNCEDTLPLPYQIQIIPKDKGIICWKYPQPRALHKVKVFPVPFNTTQHIKVNCRLEYYNEIQEEFLLYCDFVLSENETKTLDLPSNKITASIWRVIMSQSMIKIDSQYFIDETSSGSSSSSACSSNTTDDEILIKAEKVPIVKNINDVLNNSNESNTSSSIKFFLHPKILVGCMRIDSYFNINLIPKLQFNINLKTVQLNLINHMNTNILYMPKILKNYRTTSNDVITSQIFLIINLNNVKSYINFYRNTNVTVNTKLLLNCDILDYSYLSLQQLFDEVLLKCQIDYNSEMNSVNLNLISDSIRLRYGPSVVHTLTISELLWKQILSLNDNNNELIVMTRFLILNQTNNLIQFGQTDTNEEILLNSKNYFMYTFRTNNLKQLLTISIKNNDTWLKSNSININVDGVQYIKFNKNYRFLIVQIEKISTTQKKICIRGQIEVYNMTIESFKIEHKYSDSVRVMNKEKQPDGTEDHENSSNSIIKSFKKSLLKLADSRSADSKASEHPSHDKKFNENEEDIYENNLITEFHLESKNNLSLFNDVDIDETKQQCFRLRLTGFDKKGWSGEIPLKRVGKGSSPWLVKVPTNTRQIFKSFWVRVMHEQVPELQESPREKPPERLLVIIWPLFMLKSYLPINITAYEVNDSEKIYSIFGRGDVKELQLSGTHETENELLFDLNLVSPHGEDKRKTMISYKAIEKHTFFKIPEKYLSITNTIEELENTETTFWPCSREEELRCNRETIFNNTINQTTPIYNITPSKLLSCSLMLNILPWALFINSTSYDIKLVHENASNTDSCVIRSNNIGMPFMISNPFKIELHVCSGWQESIIICLAENNCRCKERNSNAHVVLAEKETIHLIFNSDLGLTKCILTTYNENGIKLFILSSYYIVINNTEYNLNIFMFSIHIKEKRNIVKPSNSTEIGSYRLYKKSLHDINNKGLITPTFFNLSSKLSNYYKKNNNNNNNNENKYNYFLVLYYENCEFSFPIYINNIFNRKCFSLLINNKYIPIAVTIIEYQEQYFIAINNDYHPSIEIINLTKNHFYIAEADNLNSNKMSLAVKECPDYHFDWYQKIGEKTNFFYTPPSIDRSFPNIDHNDCGLLFAIITDPDFQFKNIIRWSLPVRLNESKNLFLTIPQFGDIKVSIDVTFKTTTIVLNYISENLEFCVRDIRSRLSQPDNEVVLNDEEEVLIRNKIDITNEIMNSDLSIKNYEAIRNRRLKINIFIKEINVTLFNDDSEKLTKKINLLTVNLDNLVICYDDANNLFEFGLTNIQIDNQLYSTGKYDFPVVLCGQNVGQLNNNFGGHSSTASSSTNGCNNEIILLNNFIKLSNKRLQQFFYTNPNTLIYVKVNYVRCNTNYSIVIDEVYCKIRPISAYIEDTYINMLLDLIVECLPINVLYNYDNYVNFHSNHIMRETLNKTNCILPKFVIDETNNLNNLFHLRYIKIEPLSVLLSVHTCMRLYIALDHSPLDFDTFERFNVKTLPMKFGYAVGMHYLSGAIFGAGWVVGSLEILGSPSGLARSLSTGLRDFVSLPVQGLLTGPWDFLVGITYGSASLIRNITAGTVNSVTKLATSVARNLDRLTLDEEHLQRTDALRRCRPQGVTQGFSQGLTGFGISMLGAVGGLARHTLEAKSPVEVMTGVGKGIVGAIAKPISGAADLVALTGQGMLHTVGYNMMPISRPIAVEAIRTNNPETCKIVWKLQPRILTSDPILFATNATLNSLTGYKAISICLTVAVVTIVSLDSDEIIEIIPVEKITPSIDECDRTLIIFKVVSKDRYDMDIVNMTDFSMTRIHQFIRDSNDLLPKVSKRGASFGDKVEKDEDENEIRKLAFYMNENIGKHFVKYLKLLKNT